MKSTIIVIGLGRSGVGAAKLLNFEGNQVIIFESSKNPEFNAQSEALQQEGIKVELGTPLELLSFKPWLKQISSVVISPAIPWNHKTLNELRELGIPIKGEIALAWERLKGLPWIGITGTNGKTTVTHMLNHIFESNQLTAPMGGNVGNAATEIALKFRKEKISPDWLIMELSSYQLETAPEISPEIGIWTTLTPDHLERHGTLEAYGKIKRKLLENSSTSIYNADDRQILQQRHSLKKGVWVSTNKQISSRKQSDFWINEEGIVMEKNQELFDSSIIDIPGNHNLQNLLLATAASRKAGLSATAIKESIKSFSGIPHRLENLGKIGNISIFNDSKATNYESAKMGLMAVESPTIIIAGGRAKAGDPSQWIEQINNKACGIILFGECRTQLRDAIISKGFQGKVQCCQCLEEGVDLAVTIGLDSNAKSLLFSPACSSFDQYKDYESRGDSFRELISPFISK